MNEPGKCQVQISRTLLAELFKDIYANFIEVESFSAFDENTVIATIISRALPPGYHGMQEMWFTKTMTADTIKLKVEFKREQDT